MGWLTLLAILKRLICCALSVGTLTKQRSSNCRIRLFVDRTDFQQGNGRGVNGLENIAFKFFNGHGKSNWLDFKVFL